MSVNVCKGDPRPGIATRGLGGSPLEASPAETESTTGSSGRPDNPTAWQGFAAAMGKAARATGRGVATATRVTAENRHYLLPVLNGFVGDQLAQAEEARRRAAAAAVADEVERSDPVDGARDPGSTGARDDPASARSGGATGGAAGSAAIRMSFRADNRDVDVAELDLGRRLVGAGRTVVVTVHGLMGNEVLFRETRWQSTSPEQPGHGERLARELGATVLHVRYNSGLHISTNGKALSALLQRLVDAHGEDMDRLVLLCHSMGGLVGRSAGYYAQRQQQGWVDKLAAVILIGVPMRGSFLEQFANLTSVVLHRVINFYTRLGARIIDERSDGIKDLRFGLMVDEDWAEHPYDDRLFAHKTIVPPLPGVAYHVIAGSIPKDDRALLSLVFGDGLVGRTSASGDVLFCPDDPHHPCGTVRFFPGTAHLQLLLHPAVGDHVVDLVRPLVG